MTIGFASDDAPASSIGDIRVRELTWLSDAQEPPQAAAAFVSDVQAWLGGVDGGKVSRLVA